MVWRGRSDPCTRRRTATPSLPSRPARTNSASTRWRWANSARWLRIAWPVPLHAASTTPPRSVRHAAGGTYSAADKLRPRTEGSHVHTFSRRHFLGAAGGLAGLTVLGPEAWAQAKDRLVIGIPLEPPVLDPTKNAAAAIRSIACPSIFESLGRIDRNGEIRPN